MLFQGQSWAENDPTLKTPFAIMHRGYGIPVLFYFPLAPQDFRVKSPARGQVHQTIASNFLDDFSGKNAVLSRVNLSGTFGYHPTFGGVGLPLYGSLHLRTFEAIFETFNSLSRQIKAKANAVQEFIVPGRLIFWQVWIDSIEARISQRDPLLYYYEISMIRLVDYLSPVGPELPPSTLPPGAAELGGLF